MTSDGKKVALVLSGGGAKGSMQIGILKYLCEQGFYPDVIYGTSVGNLNACGYSYNGIKGTLEFWGSIKKKTDVFKFNWKSIFLQSRGVFNAHPLRKLVEKSIAGKTPEIPSFSCAVDLMTGAIKYGKAGDPDYVDYVIASASIPALCDPIGNLVDGGVREQSPLKKAIEDGADKLVVILCNPWREDPDPAPLGNWISNLLRTTDIMAHEIFINDIQACLWYNRRNLPGKRKIEIEVYCPERLVIDSLDFNQEKIQPAIQYGYECAKNGPIIKE